MPGAGEGPGRGPGFLCKGDSFTWERPALTTQLSKRTTCLGTARLQMVQMETFTLRLFTVKRKKADHWSAGATQKVRSKDPVPWPRATSSTVGLGFSTAPAEFSDPPTSISPPFKYLKSVPTPPQAPSGPR